MKIVSWNINGIRASRGKSFDNFINNENPDIVCVQETKAHFKDLSEAHHTLPSYKLYWAEGVKPGYSGVAIWVKNYIKVLKVENKINIPEFDNEGRTIIIELEKFYLINSYYPNGKEDLSRVPFKLEYSYKILELALKLRETKPVILTGDFNTAHHPIDLANPKANEKNTGFLPIERKFLDDLQSHDFIDAFRFLNPKASDIYSYWSYRFGAKPKNKGWRIDYFWVDNQLSKYIESVVHFKEENSSDHCPVIFNLKSLN